MVLDIKVGAHGDRQPCTATYRCDGTNDTARINAAITAVASAGGGNVYLSLGRFTITGDITLTAGVNLKGRGNGTILNGTATDPAYRSLLIMGSNTVRGFDVTGKLTVWVRGSNVSLSHITSSMVAQIDAAFLITYSSDISNIRIAHCEARDCNATGFMASSFPTYSITITNLTFIDCRAIRCAYAEDRYLGGDSSCWATGFDLEDCDVVNGRFIDCYSESAWESGFHCENDRSFQNVKFIRCKSINSGNRKVLRKNLAYISGGTNTPINREILTGATSGATAYSGPIQLNTGTWGAGTAAGWIEIEPISGTFVQNENVNGEGARTNLFTTPTYSGEPERPVVTDARAYYIAGFTITGGISCYECIAIDNEYGYLIGNASAGPSAGQNGQMYRCMAEGSKQFGYISSANGVNLIMEKCSIKNTIGVSIRALTHTNYQISNFQRIPTNTGTFELSGTGNISYDDDGGT